MNFLRGGNTGDSVATILTQTTQELHAGANSDYNGTPDPTVQGGRLLEAQLQAGQHVGHPQPTQGNQA